MSSRFVAKATIWNNGRKYLSGEEVPPEEFSPQGLAALVSVGQVIEEYTATDRPKGVAPPKMPGKAQAKKVPGRAGNEVGA